MSTFVEDFAPELGRTERRHWGKRYVRGSWLGVWLSGCTFESNAIPLGLRRGQKVQQDVGVLHTSSTKIDPTTALYLMGLLYRNTRTRCGSLALLCAQGSPATLRRVLYQKLPWSRRLGEGFVPGLVSKGGSLVRDDTSWQRFTRVAGAVSGAWSSRVNQPVGGRQVVFLLWPEGQGKVPPGIRRWGLQPAYSLLVPIRITRV